tara:strand:+ start:799 stop:1815 length:1017 start_codon:yes stop_codon:yes gene_type:complete
VSSLTVDIVVGLQAGDEGKGKITHNLLREREYTHCVRYNGGGNAGHTIYHKGKKFVTHAVPAGVFFGVKSIIGPGCVLNINNFFKEIQLLNENGVDTNGLIYISNNVHIIQEQHLTEDSRDKKIGTTKTGNGPAYRDKYARKGQRAQDVEVLKPYLIDFFHEMHYNEKPVVALFEGAQGYQLDVDHGDYPYVTSSHCTSAGALLNGLPPQSVRDVWGVAKIYETYVGSKPFQPNEEVFRKIQKVGNEFGATTGRPRQCNWLNYDMLNKSIRTNGATHVVFNKIDILREIGIWKLRLNDHSKSEILFQNEQEMKDYIGKAFPDTTLYFSDNPETFDLYA